MSDVYEAVGIHPDCPHENFTPISNTSLWECNECEGQAVLNAWIEILEGDKQ